ncbi:MAG: hypothetical protein KGZ41_06440 [Dethiobacter sp.]|jgi:hypothetical protein|nr:hypothetical protein [Dethiobacter sp.]MBS3983421.1 hypothetical protein [Dethiobacter sp.]MCL4463365.1 hypothetical protein [Bacillota bacterium]MCL5992561.1 hypothetical protein [Bacillota bacterium]
MAKMKQQTKQDAYTTNLLISLLVRFPEIMSINFDMPQDNAKFSFVLAGIVNKEDVKNFKLVLRDSLAAYEELTGEYLQVKHKLQRSGKLNLLELYCRTSALSLELIQLICGIVSGHFPTILVREGDVGESIHEEELLRQEEIIAYLLSHNTGTQKDNLIAFREAGKVFVYDMIKNTV